PDIGENICARNRFPGLIKKIDKGMVLSAIEVDVKGMHMQSMITTHSLNEMGLKKRDEVTLFVKSNEVSLIPQANNA
ncbi:MAG: molybdopterin-binding protein, partial [Flavobacteriales bacterium]